jgi:hypothetical protein
MKKFSILLVSLSLSAFAQTNLDSTTNPTGVGFGGSGSAAPTGTPIPNTNTNPNVNIPSPGSLPGNDGLGLPRGNEFPAQEMEDTSRGTTVPSSPSTIPNSVPTSGAGTGTL